MSHKFFHKFFHKYSDIINPPESNSPNILEIHGFSKPLEVGRLTSPVRVLGLREEEMVVELRHLWPEEMTTAVVRGVMDQKKGEQFEILGKNGDFRWF